MLNFSNNFITNPFWEMMNLFLTLSIFIPRMYFIVSHFEILNFLNFIYYRKNFIIITCNNHTVYVYAYNSD